MEARQAALEFLGLVVAHREAEAFQRFVSTDFVHHNPYSPPDAASLLAGMEAAGSAMPELSIEPLHVLEDGALVAVHSRLSFSPGGQSMAVVHIFRFKEGKIVEFWDIAQAVPEQAANSLGMF